MVKLVGVICFVLVALALSVGISAAVGYGISWVLSHFGVNVAWYVRSVAVFLLGFIVHNIRGGATA